MRRSSRELSIFANGTRDVTLLAYYPERTSCMEIEDQTFLKTRDPRIGDGNVYGREIYGVDSEWKRL